MESSSGLLTISYGWVAIRNNEITEQISKGRSAERVQTEAKVLPDQTPIIQWNCRGLNIDYTEINLLVQAFLPIAVGSTILARDNIVHSCVNLNISADG